LNGLSVERPVTYCAEMLRPLSPLSPLCRYCVEWGVKLYSLTHSAFAVECSIAVTTSRTVYACVRARSRACV